MRRRRGVALAAAALLLLGIAASGPLHRVVARWTAAAGGLLAAHPTLGAGVFVGLSALAAMVTFFSSAALVPTAIEAWGPFASLALLWAGWIGGGVTAYGLARFLGRPAVRRIASARSLGRFEAVISKGTPFGVVLLVQLAVPSEIPGYLFGLARLPFPRFVAALALAELPYALATVYASGAFLQRRLVPMAIGMAAAAILGSTAWRRLRSHIADGQAP